MLHFTSFCEAAKLTWVKKLYTSAETNGWILVVKGIFKEKHMPFIFEGNTKKKQGKGNLKFILERSIEFFSILS